MSDERNVFLDDGHETGMDVESFLKHSTKGGGGSFLSSDWKDDGEITLWFHRKHNFHAVWFHNWYRVIEIKDRDSGKAKRIAVSVRWNCRDHHPENGKTGDKLLRKARFRDDTGAREHAPVLCPFCRFEDWLAVEVTAGRIGFVEPVFRFSPDEAHPDEKAIVLHSGGIVGFYVEKNMTSDEKKAIKDARIKLSEAWKDKTLPRCNYLLVVVDDARPEDGALKFFAAEGCGDKMKKAIRDEMNRDRKNPKRGNPIENPYPLWIKYDEKQSFDDKYDVSVLANAGLAHDADDADRAHYAEILAEIDGERLDLSQELEPGNCAQLLSDFESHGLIDAPWASFFEEAEKAGLMKVSDTRRKRSATRSEDAEDEPEEAATKPASAKQEPPAEAYRCDACDGLLAAATSVVCKACGAVYDEKGELAALACVGCKEKVVVPAPGAQATCKACKTIHAFDRVLQNAGTEDEYEKPVWTKVEPPKEEAPKARRGRRPKADAAKEA